MIGSRHIEVEQEKEQVTLISTEKVRHLCKCWSKTPTLKRHTKEVFSNGTIRLECSHCGQPKIKIKALRR